MEAARASEQAKADEEINAFNRQRAEFKKIAALDKTGLQKEADKELARILRLYRVSSIKKLHSDIVSLLPERMRTSNKPKIVSEFSRSNREVEAALHATEAKMINESEAVFFTDGSEGGSFERQRTAIMIELNNLGRGEEVKQLMEACCVESLHPHLQSMFENAPEEPEEAEEGPPLKRGKHMARYVYVSPHRA
jgi:hypothetical protein